MDNTSKTSTEKVVKRGKQNGYKNSVLHAKREAKFRAAVINKARYQGLSVEERIKLVKSRRGESNREMDRLLNLLVKQSVVAKVVAKVEAAPVEEKKVRTPKSKVVRTAKQVKPSKS